MPKNARFLICAALLIVSTIVGGGGSPSPVPELIVELAALVALGAWWLAPKQRDDWPLDRSLWIGTAIFVAVPILQLIPLPPALWQALPGRESEIAALNLIGQASSWRPISTSPYRTIAAALSLIPPIVMLFFVSRASLQERAHLLGVVAVLGICAALIGVLQVASGAAHWFLPYPHQISGVAAGFQANSNAGADMLLVALVALFGYVALRRDLIATGLGKLIAGALALLLVLTIALTGSRAGTMLILLPLAAGGLMIFPKLGWSRVAMGTTVIVALLGVAGTSFGNAQLGRTWSRFAHLSEARPELWKDTVYAIGQNWPIGSGLGTFEPTMTAVERLEVVDAAYPNRAHNDYLEFALEAGIAGVLVLIAAACFLAVRAWRILHHTGSSRNRIQAVASLAILAVLGLHSIVDYPMRSLALASLAAMAIGLLSRVATGRGDVREVW